MPRKTLIRPFDTKGPREAEAFEAHLLCCELCFQDLKCLDRAGVVIREFTGAKSPALDRLRNSLLRATGPSAQGPTGGPRSGTG